MKTWLVEIRVKDWIDVEDPILDFVEVELSDYSDMFAARHAGFDEFVRKMQYQPRLQKRVESICNMKSGVYSNYFCAPDAVCLS